jgi:hypothetical protein
VVSPNDQQLTGPTESDNADDMNADLKADIQAAQDQFDPAAARARSDMAPLWIVALCTGAVAAVLGSLGLFRRINEYR